MLTGVAILVLTACLFVLWFRYACLLILQTRTLTDYTTSVASASRLSVLQVQSWLEMDRGHESLDHLFGSLQSDFTRISALLTGMPRPAMHLTRSEERLIRLDFHVMRASYACTRRISPSRSRAALEEMACVVGFLANTAGSTGFTAR
jgi:hypothetical protein